MKKSFHFCDALIHLKKVKWHTHSADSCRALRCWLKSKEDDDPATTDVGDTENVTPSDTNELDEHDPPFDLTALLASAMNMVIDNGVVKDLITNAINASSSNI